MPSPFPGMDPYIESPAQWSDFHHEFISALRGSLRERLPQGYHAKIEEFVLRLEPEADPPRRKAEPDVVIGHHPGFGAGRSGTGSAAVAEPESEPVTIPNIIALDPHTEGYIELYHLPEHELVAVIELLSPANKSGSGRGQYIAKREMLLEQRVHLIELDLIRAGRRLQLDGPLPEAHYYAFISRGDRRPDCNVYHWTVRQPFPSIPIPLRKPDPDVWIDLAEPFRVAFERGDYGRFIRYDQPPAPPKFEPADTQWVAQTASSALKSKEPGHA